SPALTVSASAPAVLCTPSASTAIYTLSLHDALPIYGHRWRVLGGSRRRHDSPGVGVEPVQPAVLHQGIPFARRVPAGQRHLGPRSEEHTSELQSREKLVCRLLLEKKNQRRGAWTEAR